MKRVWTAALVMLIGFLNGCALLNTDHLHVAPELKATPVHKLAIFPAGFPKHVRRYWPGDLQAMLPKNQSATSATIVAETVSVLNSHFEVSTAYVDDAALTKWAEKISKDLAEDKIPVAVSPVDLPVDAVLLVGVAHYGTYMTQFFYTILWGDPHVLGPMKWEHNCDLQFLAVNPRTGKVLLDLRKEAKVKDLPREDPEVMRRVLREVIVELDKVLSNPGAD